MEDTQFSEKQSFRQPWLVILILLINIAAWTRVIAQIGYGLTLRDTPMDTTSLVISYLLLLAFTIWMLVLRLETEVKSDGVYFRFWPFHAAWQKILFSEMIWYEARKYKPIKEYGGWGIRYGLFGKHGKAYNVSG